MSDLVSLYPHPEGRRPWPTEAWAEEDFAPGVDRGRLEKALDRVFVEPWPESHGETHALVVIQNGALVVERYGPEYGPDETLVSWSMAKSMLHAVVGILVGENKLELHAPASVPAWQAEDDPRRAITLDQLLRMSSGLHFVEDYLDEVGSDCIRMLFGTGKADVAGYAEAQVLDHPPDSFWSYSSGTSNIVSALAARAIGDANGGMEGFLRREIWGRLGMRSAVPRFDDAGNWIASSFVFATARDFARFGYLYLRDGVWEGERMLPEGWVDYARTATPRSSGWYGAHWWLSLDGSGRFHASGYRGQNMVVDPARDLVVVRLGNSTPEQRVNVMLFMKEIVESFPEPPR